MNSAHLRGVDPQPINQEQRLIAEILDLASRLLCKDPQYMIKFEYEKKDENPADHLTLQISFDSRADSGRPPAFLIHLDGWNKRVFQVFALSISGNEVVNWDAHTRKIRRSNWEIKDSKDMKICDVLKRVRKYLRIIESKVTAEKNLPLKLPESKE